MRATSQIQAAALEAKSQRAQGASSTSTRSLPIAVAIVMLLPPPSPRIAPGRFRGIAASANRAGGWQVSRDSG